MNYTRRTRDAYIADHQERARKSFEHHVIRSRDDRSWVCQRPYTDEKGGWDSTFWFEAIVLAGGELYVHGDIDGMHFAHYGKHETKEEVLRWMGETRDLGYYVAQKARIGMGSVANQCVESVDEGVWLDDALQHVEERARQRAWDAPSDDEDVEASEDDEDEVVVVNGKRTNVEDLPVSEEVRALIRDVLSSGFEDALNADKHKSAECYEAGAFEWGQVPSYRLIFAHEALRCLVRLLDAEKAMARETA
jgi:hypothetical protein